MIGLDILVSLRLNRFSLQVPLRVILPKLVSQILSKLYPFSIQTLESVFVFISPQKRAAHDSLESASSLGDFILELLKFRFKSRLLGLKHSTVLCVFLCFLLCNLLESLFNFEGVGGSQCYCGSG